MFVRYRVGICDDEELTCSHLGEAVRQYFASCDDEVDIYIWNTGEELKRDVPDKVELDVLLLDIELPGCNGIDVGKYIREEQNNDSMCLIYISSKTNYAMELFENHPYNFLVKPIDEELLYKDLKRFLQLEKSNRRFFTYDYKKINYQIAVGSIIYFESDRKHIKIVTNDRNYEYVGKIKDEYIKLPQYFVMIGQSFIVNIRHIKLYRLNSVIMDNGDELNVSRGYKKKFDEIMMEYNLENI